MSDNPRNGHDDDRQIERYYTRLLDEHGDSVAALDWGSDASQRRRFEAMAGIAKLDGKSVLDVGCGLAHFRTFLEANGIEVDYTGFDLTPAMVEHAKRLHPGVRIEVRNVVEEHLSETFDYVFASGLFYLRRNDPRSYLRSMAARLYGLCREGVAFNALSTRGAGGVDEFRADPGLTLEMALDIADRAAIRHDYLPNDFTVYLYRGNFAGDGQT